MTTEFQLWVGTPNEMGLLTSGTLATVKNRAKQELLDRKEMAEKFDRAALGGINECREGIVNLTPSMLMGGPRTWTFPFIGINFRMEIRK